MTTTPPVVTEDEIRAILDDDVTYTITEIARRVWTKRGGTGSYDDARHRVCGTPEVPIVTKHHVRRPIEAMTERGEVVRATGSAALAIGIPHGGARENYTFFTLAARAKAFQAEAARQAQLAGEAQQLSDDLARVLPGDVTVSVAQRTRISLMVPVERARALFALLRK